MYNHHIIAARQYNVMYFQYTPISNHLNEQQNITNFINDSII